MTTLTVFDCGHAPHKDGNTPPQRGHLPLRQKCRRDISHQTRVQALFMWINVVWPALRFRSQIFDMLVPLVVEEMCCGARRPLRRTEVEHVKGLIGAADRHSRFLT